MRQSFLVQQEVEWSSEVNVLKWLPIAYWNCWPRCVLIQIRSIVPCCGWDSKNRFLWFLLMKYYASSLPIATNGIRAAHKMILLDEQALHHLLSKSSRRTAMYQCILCKSIFQFLLHMESCLYFTETCDPAVLQEKTKADVGFQWILNPNPHSNASSRNDASIKSVCGSNYPGKHQEVSVLHQMSLNSNINWSKTPFFRLAIFKSPGTTMPGCINYQTSFSDHLASERQRLKSGPVVLRLSTLSIQYNAFDYWWRI